MKLVKLRTQEEKKSKKHVLLETEKGLRIIKCEGGGVMHLDYLLLKKNN